MLSRLLKFVLGGALVVILVMTTLPPLSHAQDAGGQKIESDDARVVQSGNWTTQTAAGASDGNYRYSSGSEDDVLSLAFEGTALEILYIAGPSLGTLAIEVDGTVLRTVITTAESTAFAQTTKINYLADEAHTLKVYAQDGGVIAIDAFVISQLQPVNEAVLANAAVDNQAPQVVPCAFSEAVRRVSVSSTGAEANAGNIWGISMSHNGRYVAFQNDASTLVANDTNGMLDVFVHDRQTCTTTLVSVASNGTQGNAWSERPDISADGRYVAFQSSANNLVTGDTGHSDIFVHDRQTGQTTRVSVSSQGAQANGSSTSVSISADGRYVAFHSYASNLVPGDTNGGTFGTNAADPSEPNPIIPPFPPPHGEDIFVHDRQTGQTTRVSVSSWGQQGQYSSRAPDISADGRYVAFESYSDLAPGGYVEQFINVYVHDRQTGQTTLESITNGTNATPSNAYQPTISGDGRYIVFESAKTNLVVNDTNGLSDIFLRDRQTGQMSRASVASDGSQANAGSGNPFISTDGRYVIFASSATNLDPDGSRGFFRRDLQTSQTTFIPLMPPGQVATSGLVLDLATSPDGHFIAFWSNISNFVPDDTNGQYDVFVIGAPGWVAPDGDRLALVNAAGDTALLPDMFDNTTPTNLGYLIPTPTTAQWLMGDWDGNGSQTPGLYYFNEGIFAYTNTTSGTPTWSQIWIGLLNRPAVVGQFSAAGTHDCIGVVDNANFPPYGTAFALYFTCDLTHDTAPALTFQWLSILLPDSSGFSGTYQFAAGDFNHDGLDTVAVRRGEFIAFTNVPPTTLLSEFNLAQYWGTPPTTNGDYGRFLAGDFDDTAGGSFGVYYQNGNFYYRNSVEWSPPGYELQRIGQPVGTPISATVWQ